MLARDMSDWVWQGERGMLRSFDGSTAEANAAARALSDEVTAARFTEVADVVPGARTVLVELVPGTEPSGGLIRALEADEAQLQRGAGRRHEIAVTYDGEDLAEVAASCRMRPFEVVELHSRAEYTVAFIGFQPGFPNVLVSNEEGAAAIEFTMRGPTIAFEDDAIVALTGSRFEVSILRSVSGSAFERDVDATPAPYQTSFRLRAGESLRIGATLGGAR